MPTCTTRLLNFNSICPLTPGQREDALLNSVRDGSQSGLELGASMRSPQQTTGYLARIWIFAGLAASTVIGFTGNVQAETIRIVAIGSSNISGHAVGGKSGAWPARMEAILRAKGYDVTVSNHGITGDTSAGILSRLDGAVTPGTKIVFFDAGAGNDRRAGIGGQTAANQAAIAQRIRARGAVAIFTGYPAIVGTEQANPSAWVPNDPHNHLTAQSQAKVAAVLAQRAIAAIGKNKQSD